MIHLQQESCTVGAGCDGECIAVAQGEKHIVHSCYDCGAVVDSRIVTDEQFIRALASAYAAQDRGNDDVETTSASVIYYDRLCRQHVDCADDIETEGW